MSLSGILLLAVVAGILVLGVWLPVWLALRQQRRRLLAALHYLLDRLAVQGCDLERLTEQMVVVRAALERKGLLDAEEFAGLHRELVEIPRRRQAEQAELLDGIIEDEKNPALVKDFPDTVQ